MSGPAAMTTTLTITDLANGATLGTLDVSDNWRQKLGAHVDWPTVDAHAVDLGSTVTTDAVLVGGRGCVTIIDDAGEHDVWFDRPVSDVAVTAKAKPPPTVVLPPMPAGYAVSRSYDAAQLHAALSKRTGNQGGTESYSLTKNVALEGGLVRFKTLVEPTNGYQYSSAYADIGSSTPTARLPLFCRVQVLARYPYTFCNWCSLWLDAYGSANNMELDFGEMFSPMSPGYNNCQVHSPIGPGKNLIRGAGNGSASQYGSTKIYGQTQGAIPCAPGTPVGAQRIGVQSYSFDTTPGHSGFHLIECEVSRVANGTGWRPQVDFYFDGVRLVTWADTYTPVNQTPTWYKPGDDAHVWDLRFDNWIGGGDFPRCTKNGQPLFVYDRTNKAGTSTYLAPIGTVPDADLWIADPKAVYSMDVAAVRVLTKA